MYCPHCGAENDESNRFCVNCGSELSSERRSPTAKEGPRARLAELIGTTRRARLVTAATVLAAAVAVIAFLSLNSDDDTDGSSVYLQQLDRECVAEKERIIALEQQVLSQQPPDLQAFASVLVTSLAEWRANLRRDPPPRSAEAIDSLEAAIIETLIRSGTLARAIRAKDADDVISRRAREVDEATAQVDRVIEALDLPECTQLQVSPAGVQP
jgi:hypothetical protein